MREFDCSINRSARFGEVRAHGVESESPSATDSRDYRRGRLLGAMMVEIGTLLAAALIVIALSGPPGIPWVWTIEAMVVPALLLLTGLLVIGRAKLALWLMFLLTADFVY